MTGSQSFEYRTLTTISTIDNIDPLIEQVTLETFGCTGMVTIMLIPVLVGMPVVIGYTVFIYRTFSGPVRGEDADGAY